MGDETAFRAAGHAWRLFCGPEVIERDLRMAVERAGGKRAFVVCSPSVNRKTDTVHRIAAALGDRYAGVFDGIEKDSTFTTCRAAQEAASAASADLLVAVGGGSVIVAVRAVAIFLGEPGHPLQIMTQYPDAKPAFSPRLMAPKMPIINVPTTPTSAMNRAGTGLKNPELDHRMEFFDPKTRPQAILLDHDALAATPADIVRSTATTVFAGSVGAIAATAANPLVEGDRNQAFHLARRAYLSLANGEVDPASRVDLCLAAFLQNRAEDDGARGFRGNAFSSDYAVATALHLRYPQVGQGEATAALQASKIRLSDPVDAGAASRVALQFGAWRDGMEARQAALAVADALEAIYVRIGVPTRIRELGIPRQELRQLAAETVKNFNANPGVRSTEDQAAGALRLLEAAY